MSLQKKTIFSENKRCLQALTPTYSKIKCQPLTETSQQSNSYFLKQNLSQNSNFLKNFKNKHLNSATPMINSLIEHVSEAPINPFLLAETPEINKESPDIKNYQSNEKKEINDDSSNTFSFDMVESFEEPTSQKVINKLTVPFYKSLSPSKAKQKSIQEKNMHGNLKNAENKENKGIHESNILNGIDYFTTESNKNSKVKLNFRKRSEVFENEKEEFSASKNLLHSSRINKPSLNMKQKEDDTEGLYDDKRVKNLEIELANEKSKVAEFQHINDELIFEIKNLNSEIERMQTLLNDKDTHFNELISIKEQFKNKLEVNVEYSDYLKSVNLKLLDQINNLIKAKMIGKTL